MILEPEFVDTTDNDETPARSVRTGRAFVVLRAVLAGQPVAQLEQASSESGGGEDQFDRVTVHKVSRDTFDLRFTPADAISVTHQMPSP